MSSFERFHQAERFGREHDLRVRAEQADHLPEDTATLTEAERDEIRRMADSMFYPAKVTWPNLRLLAALEATEARLARWEAAINDYENRAFAAEHQARQALHHAADEVRRIRENGLDPDMEWHPNAEHFEQWLRERGDRYLRDGQ